MSAAASGRRAPGGGIMPARSLRIIFSPTSACAGASSIAKLASDRPPAFPFSLWQPAQYCLTSVSCVFGVVGCGVCATTRFVAMDPRRTQKKNRDIGAPVYGGLALRLRLKIGKRGAIMSVRILALALLTLWLSAPAHAQVQTGSIAGIVTDESSAVLPGATVSLSGERLIGGTQTQTTDATGAYRFDRLPPSTYTVLFELQGFKSLERKDIIVNATFVATVNAKLGVGSVSETVTVTGESPTVDVRSNLQQTVMNQTVLEGVPSGRDPWSVAKIIPGVQVSTYDVGGTQSFQQSSLSAHGSSTNDVSYNIDGATVNWPGGGGGATMMYYDQGMFEEVNYMTSAIPAEVMAGGISINMVTKDAGNKWRGNVRY